MAGWWMDRWVPASSGLESCIMDGHVDGGKGWELKLRVPRRTHVVPTGACG